MLNELRAYVLLSAVVLFMVTGVLVVNDLSYEDELAQQSHYCEMTGEGYWPEYRARHEEVCRDN